MTARTARVIFFINAGNMEGKMKDRGVSHIELVVVMAAVGIFVAALGFYYDIWIKRYAVEKIVKELYMDMMHARTMAITCGREHYIVLYNRSYSVVEDANDSGKHDTGDRTLPNYPKQLEHPIEWNNTGNELIFDRKGIMPKWRTIRVIAAEADFNCIKISQSRIIMGQYEGAECHAK